MATIGEHILTELHNTFQTLRQVFKQINVFYPRSDGKCALNETLGSVGVNNSSVVIMKTLMTSLDVCKNQGIF